MMQAGGLVGSTVNVQVNSQTATSGVVSGVAMESGTPEIMVNGTAYPLSQVTSITPPVVATGTASGTPAQ
jgi:flagellar basal-body rod modification protein FlgD